MSALKSDYRLCYLTEDDRQVCGLEPCHLCCFGGRQLRCLPLCSELGERALFIENDFNAISQMRQRVKAAREKYGLKTAGMIADGNIKL